MASEASDAALDSVKAHIRDLEADKADRGARLGNIDTAPKEEIVRGLWDFLAGIRKRKVNFEEDVRLKMQAAREYGDGKYTETGRADLNVLNEKHRLLCVIEEDILHAFPFLKDVE